ncbi:MAG: hypothetical protein KC586_31405 [Myxococcales bacterium]|nr:hypothetical protein [Myxococcales bacterium]
MGPPKILVSCEYAPLGRAVAELFHPARVTVRSALHPETTQWALCVHLPGSEEGASDPRTLTLGDVGQVDGVPLHPEAILSAAERMSALRFHRPSSHERVVHALHLGAASAGRRTGLTAHQVDVVRSALTHPTRASVAADLGLSERTVEHHASRIRRRTGLSLEELVRAVFLSTLEVALGEVPRDG